MKISWLSFCLLLITLFLCKAVIYLSIIPPFEGWDEYQHLAYIKYLDEKHEQPVLAKSFVSRSFLKDIVVFPASEFMREQTGAAGSVSYQDFFNTSQTTPQYNDTHHDIPLYEAQHGALYYRLMLPVSRMFTGDHQLLNEIFLLRILNILFVAASLGAILWWFKNLALSQKHAVILGLLIIGQPLILINGCRIANDALSIMAGTGVMVIGMSPQYRQRLLFSITSGILIGLACWAKSTATILFPFWFCCLGISLYRKEITLRHFFISILASYALAFLVVGQHLFFNIKNYGMLFVMQEAFAKTGNRDFFNMLQIFADSPIISDIFTLWSSDSIWVGGWSFLKVRHISDFLRSIVAVALLSWIYNFFRKKRTEGVFSPDSSFLCLAVIFFTSLALGWHYLLSKLAWGRPTTCVWYTCMSLPFFLAFTYDSASRWSTRTGSIFGWFLIAIYLYADIRGSLTMISFYSGGARGREALARIASLHPSWLGTTTLIIATILFFCIFIYLLKTALAAQKDPRISLGTPDAV